MTEAMSAFGKMLERLIRARDESVHGWAKTLPEGPSASHVGNLTRGKRTPSADDMKRLAEHLGLTGDMRRLFFRLGWIAHLPEEAQDEFESIVRDLERLRFRPKSGSGE